MVTKVKSDKVERQEWQDLAKWCDAAIAELDAAWKVEIEEQQQSAKSDPVWWRTKAWIKVQQAITYAKQMGALKVAEGLVAALNINRFQLVSWRGGISLLELCRDECRRQAKKAVVTHGSKTLAEAILKILESNLGKVFTAEELATLLLKDGIELPHDPYERNAAISKAVRLLRDDGYDIPKGRYVLRSLNRKS